MPLCPVAVSNTGHVPPDQGWCADLDLGVDQVPLDMPSLRAQEWT